MSRQLCSVLSLAVSTWPASVEAAFFEWQNLIPQEEVKWSVLTAGVVALLIPSLIKVSRRFLSEGESSNESKDPPVRTLFVSMRYVYARARNMCMRVTRDT